MPKGVGCVWLPFNFGNIYFIPSTDAYVEHEYTIARNHLMLTSEQNVKVIERKAKKVRGMLKRRVKFMTTQPDVARMLDKLKK